MAERLALRVWLTNLGSGDDQVSDAIIAQGLDSIADLAELTVDDVSLLCSTARRPGGQIEQRQHDGVGAPNIQISNPGVKVPARFQMKLELAVRAARYFASVARPITAVLMNWPCLRHFSSLKEICANWTDPDPLPSLGRSIPIMKMIELIRNYLRRVLGIRKIPLAYVVRSMVAVPPIGDAPLRTAPSSLPYGAKYSSFHDEQIERASHDHPGYAEDNATVMDIILTVVQGTSFMSSVKTAVTNRDGRTALLALEQHNLGDSKWDEVIRKAEHNVLQIKWKGNNTRFTLRKHLISHRDAHNDMVRASEAEGYEYQVPTDHTRIQRLLNSIESKDQRIVAGVANIKGDPAQFNTYETTAEYLQQVAPPITSGGGGGAQNISVVGTDGVVYSIAAVTSGGSSGGFKPAKIGKTGVELRYYKRKAFMKFSDAQKAELSAWRDEQEKSKGNKRKRGGGSGGDDSQKKFKDLASQISALASSVGDLKSVTEKTIGFKDQDARVPAPPILKPPTRPTQCKHGG